MKDARYKELARHIAELETPEQVMWLLDQLLTAGEIRDVCDRLTIYSLLSSEKHSQRDVARLAKVSISKVERGATNTQSPEVRAYFREHFAEG